VVEPSEQNGVHPGPEQDQHDSGDLFGPRILLARTSAMAEFSGGQNTTAQRLAAIEQQVREWDWRREQEGAPAEASPRAPRHRVSAGVAAPGRRLWAVVVGSVVVVAAVIGIILGTGSSPPSPPAPGHSLQAQQFAAADETVTQGGVVVASGFNSLKGVPTVALVANVTDPYVAALTRFERQVGEIHLTRAQRLDGVAVLSQAHQFSSFLHTLNGLNPLDLGTWIHQFYAHVVSLTEASAVLRHELGLPALPTT
jgi:hypothetical protein